MTTSIKINQALVAAADVALYVLAFYLSFYLRYGWHLPTYNLEPFTFMLPWFVLVFVIMLAVYDLYSIYIKYDEILAALICIVFLTAIANISLTFFFRQFAVPRSIFLLSSLVQLLLLAAWRYFVWRRGLLVKYPQKALIIGYPGEIKKLLASINVSLDKGLMVVKELRLTNKDNFCANWNNYLDSSVAAEVKVILLCSALSQEDRNMVFKHAIREGKTVMLVPQVYDVLLQSAKLVSAGDVPIMQLQGIMADSSPSLVKRAMDIGLSLVALLLVLPLVPFITAAIKLDSPGPVFYRQQRSGLKGRTFWLYKFRTMVEDAEKHTGPVLTEQKDRRVTRVGRFLRSTRLDELPQFFNILKGDMSLVGPRPERPFFLEEFSDNLPEFEYRHQLIGGLTGLAQVEGRYSTGPANKLIYDLYYAQRRSLLQDIAIILRTAGVMLQRRRAS